MILINFKLYSQTFSDHGVKLAKIIQEVSQQRSFPIVITASSLEAYRLSSETGAKVWLQHVDDYSEGRGTGYISPLQAEKLGITGSLLNHSEHQLSKGTVLKTIKSRPAGFTLVCCAKSIGQIAWIKKASPDFILYEPPELIASPDKSIATENPKSIVSAVAAAGNVPLMVGAGIKDGNDVKICLKMGAKAIGLASAFVSSTDPRALLEELVDGFKML
jgi:triosephosphate isomerase